MTRLATATSPSCTRYTLWPASPWRMMTVPLCRDKTQHRKEREASAHAAVSNGLERLHSLRTARAAGRPRPPLAPPASAPRAGRRGKRGPTAAAAGGTPSRRQWSVPASHQPQHATVSNGAQSTAVATNGALSARTWYVARSSVHAATSVAARTVAEHGAPYRSASSPNESPGCARSTRSPSPASACAAGTRGLRDWLAPTLRAKQCSPRHVSPTLRPCTPAAVRAQGMQQLDAPGAGRRARALLLPRGWPEAGTRRSRPGRMPSPALPAAPARPQRRRKRS